MKTINFTVLTALALVIGCSSSDGPAPFTPGGGGGTGGTAGGGTGGSGDPCSAIKGAELCNSVCVLTSSDKDNCGMCNKKCNDGENCVNGACTFSCISPLTKCNNTCVDVKLDKANCGGCGKPCAQGEMCSDGACGTTCGGTTKACGTACADIQNDPKNCGDCNKACATGEYCNKGTCEKTCAGTLCDVAGNMQCFYTDIDELHCGSCTNKCEQGEVCTAGVCTCTGGLKDCGGNCVNVDNNVMNCGSCGHTCAAGEQCNAGVCMTGQCASGLQKCGADCVKLASDPLNCGNCGIQCTGGNSCVSGQCVACDSATTDCDGDGWMAADGDCCDKPGVCGTEPGKVNPGAIEVVGNAVDDNCNGKTDLFDMEDTVSCDSGLLSNSQLPTDFAKALGICRTTEENPAELKNKTWGLIDAKIMKADGTALEDWNAVSIRESFGSASMASREGQRLVVISTGIASDGTQTNPGPNGGVPNGSNVSESHSPTSTVDIAACTTPYCLKDWYNTENLPLKPGPGLPDSPSCSASDDSEANDSVMLVLRLRAPTNVRAFSFNTYFYSAEYPEFVCSSFNDQLIALVDTPSGTPSPIPNPVDKNLMTYTKNGQQWPIGVNIAHDTSLFAVCESQTANPSCWDTNVSTDSCILGADQLAGTGFEADPNDPYDTCTIGGGTFWLTTAGNVIPGQIVEIRIAIWDVGDHSWDSMALVDGFKWLASATLPGTGN